MALVRHRRQGTGAGRLRQRRDAPRPRSRPIARRAPTARPWCWARCSAPRPRRWRRWWRRAAPTSCPSPTTSPAAQRGVWIMGIAAPPQVRRVVDHAVDAGIKRFAAFAPQTSYGEQMVRTLESQVAVRGGTVAGGRALRSQQRRPHDGRQASRRRGSRARASSPCWCRWRRPACRRRWPRWPPPASTTSPRSSSAPACGTCPASAPTRCCAAPGMPRPIRRGAPTSSAASSRPTAGRRIAWRRSPMTAWRWPAISRA